MIVRATIKVEQVEPKLDEALVFVSQAASAAGVSAAILTRAIHNGELPSYRRVETRTLVYMSEVFAALDGATQRGEPPRVCRRPQLLRGRGYDEQDDEQVFR